MQMRGKPQEQAFWPNGLPGPDIENGQNPVVITTDQTGYDRDKQSYFQTNAQLDIKIPWVRGLKLTGTAAIDKRFRATKRWEIPWTLYQKGTGFEADGKTPLLVASKRGPAEPRLTVGDENQLNILLGAIATYERKIDDHSITILAGTNRETIDGDNFNAYRRFFISPALDQIFAGGDLEKNNGGGAFERARLNYFGRVAYNYKEKYLAEFLWRYDGSYIFPENTRYGFFPAASLGWVITEEDFLKENKYVSFLKLRGSYGLVGNAEIGNFPQLGLFSGDAGYAGVAGQRPSQIGNPDLRWETTAQLDFGLDFGLLKNRINGEIDYYVKNTTGLLLNVNVPATTGFFTQVRNVGSLENKGFEFVLGYRGESSGGLKYNIMTNFTHFRDRITELPENVRPAYPGNLVNTIIGRSQFDIFGYKTAGLFQSQAEVDAAPTQVGAGPGRIRYVDINEDGRIDDLDRTWIGTTLPALEYGIRADVFYKKFDFSFFGSGVAGREGFDAYTVFNNLMRGRENVGPGVFDAWTPQNTSSNIPALTLKDNNGEGRTSDYFIVNTSYFKIRNLQVGYTVKDAAVFESLRFFLMGENLFWLKSKSYQGPDPERIDLDPVPIPKTFTFGVNASF